LQSPEKSEEPLSSKVNNQVNSLAEQASIYLENGRGCLASPNTLPIDPTPYQQNSSSSQILDLLGKKQLSLGKCRRWKAQIAQSRAPGNQQQP
jgi:hypothetical protein